MNNPLPDSPLTEAASMFDLREMADSLTKSFLPLASRNQSFFVNDIPEDLYLGTNPAAISSILGDLLFSMISNAKDTCIQLTAKIYSDVILVHVKDCSTFNSYAVSSSLQRLQPLVERMGGFVNITSQRKKVTTVAFCFPNIPVAA
jgi:hypothetical protein